MLTVIAEILRDKLSTLSWIERTGGLALAAARANYRTGADMVAVQDGVQVFPVSATVNLQECWEDGTYKLLEPDSLKSGVAFFVDGGGVQMVGYEGPKLAAVRFKFNLKLLCWLNISRLGSDITDGSANVSGRIVAYFADKMLGRHSATGLFGGGIEEDAFKQIDVLEVDELTKSPSMFEPYDFVKRSELFFYPYDYFGLMLRGEFVMPVRCLPEFGADWSPFDGCLAPGGDVNWFSRAMAVYLASLPVINSNEDALAGILADGGTIDPLSVGDPYWSGGGHVAGADSFMRVV